MRQRKDKWLILGGFCNRRPKATKSNPCRLGRAPEVTDALYIIHRVGRELKRVAPSPEPCRLCRRAWELSSQLDRICWRVPSHPANPCTGLCRPSAGGRSRHERFLRTEGVRSSGRAT